MNFHCGNDNYRNFRLRFAWVDFSLCVGHVAIYIYISLLNLRHCYLTMHSIPSRFFPLEFHDPVHQDGLPSFARHPAGGAAATVVTLLRRTSRATTKQARDDSVISVVLTFYIT